MLFGISRNTVVKIVIPGGSNQTVVGATLRIQNAIDYAGNNVDAPFVVTVVPLRTPKVTSVYQTDSNKLTFVFDEELFEVLTDAFNIVIDNGTTVDHFTREVFPLYAKMENHCRCCFRRKLHTNLERYQPGLWEGFFLYAD